MPERMLRSTTALVGGALRESTALLVPQAFRSSRTYSVFVQQMLDFLVTDVGGVAPANGAATPPQVENFVARKAVGNFVELAGWATIHLSPLTVLSLVSDIAYGSQAYLKELADELKRNGVIAADSTIDDAADLLAAVSQASSVTSKAFDTPPLSVEGLRQTIEQTREALSRVDPTTLIPQAELERLWNEMHVAARREGVSLFDLSSAMTMDALQRLDSVGSGALSSITVAGNMFDRHILSHYAGALLKIQKQGFYATLADSSRPYLEATWRNFSTEKTTFTESLLSGRLVSQAWRGAIAWWGGPSSDDAPADAAKLADAATTSDSPPVQDGPTNDASPAG